MSISNYEKTLNLEHKGVRFAVWDLPDTNDKYTAFLPDKSVIGLNTTPFHPSFGFCQYVGDYPSTYPGKHLGTKILDIKELNEDVLNAIVQRYE